MQWWERKTDHIWEGGWVVGQTETVMHAYWFQHVYWVAATCQALDLVPQCSRGNNIIWIIYNKPCQWGRTGAVTLPGEFCSLATSWTWRQPALSAWGQSGKQSLNNSSQKARFHLASSPYTDVGRAEQGRSELPWEIEGTKAGKSGKLVEPPAVHSNGVVLPLCSLKSCWALMPIWKSDCHHIQRTTALTTLLPFKMHASSLKRKSYPEWNREGESGECNLPDLRRTWLWCWAGSRQATLASSPCFTWDAGWHLLTIHSCQSPCSAFHVVFTEALQQL